MIRLFAAGAVLMAMLIPFSATAGPNRVFETGNDLYEACTNPFSALFCQGFVSAVADVMGTTQIEGFTACIPFDVTVGQAVDVVKRYLEANRDKRHLTAMSLVAAALDDGFPCR
jgi:hypothetical protein